MSKLNKRAIIGAVAVAVVATAVVIIVLRPKHHLEDLPVVSVDTVRTRNVEIYGEFPGRSAPSSSWRCGRGSKAILRR